MIYLYRDTVNKIVIPSLYCKEKGDYLIDLVFQNEGQEKTISTSLSLSNGRLYGQLEHVCGPLSSTDNKINFDVGTYPVEVKHNNIKWLSAMIKIQ